MWAKISPQLFMLFFITWTCFIRHTRRAASFCTFNFLNSATDIILVSYLVKCATDGMQWLVNSLVGSTWIEPVHVCNLRKVPTLTSPTPPPPLLFPIMQIALLVGPQHRYSSCGRGGVLLAEVVFWYTRLVLHQMSVMTLFSMLILPLWFLGGLEGGTKHGVGFLNYFRVLQVKFVEEINLISITVFRFFSSAGCRISGVAKT